MEPAFAPSLSLVRRSATLALRHRSPVLPFQHVSSTRRPHTHAVTSSPVACAVPIGKRMTSGEIRDAFLSFYQQRAHERLASASLIPEDPTVLLTIAGMLPFKPVFLGLRPRPFPRVTTSQKCLRTNDVENVGRTKHHHTFFEMLGNFSFGDYFKTDAIQWAWQLLTDVYGIPPKRLVVSVFENDHDAFDIWRNVVGGSDCRILRKGEKHNFWASGPTGPCGPCSEIFFDSHPDRIGPLDLDDQSRFVELYNLVFMQYSRDSSGNLSALAHNNIDTGMGLERMAQVLQRVDTNYETDLILPIIQCVARVSNRTLSELDAHQKTSIKVVADHMRAVAYLIADGVLPSTVGKGYIVRRLIRRLVRHTRLLGINQHVTGDILPVVADLATEAGFMNVRDRFDHIARELDREELRFLTTLERGENRLAEVLDSAKACDNMLIKGDDAFELYDTYGFPLELMEEIAKENGLTVDKEGFEQFMAEQRNRARAAHDNAQIDVKTAAILSEASAVAGPTVFHGYNETSLEIVTVTALLVEGCPGLSEVANEGDMVRVLLEKTPFYAEGGGQIGDSGLLTASDGVILVTDTRKEAGAYVHIGRIIKGQVMVGDIVHAAVNANARRRIMAHHTATHLLQAALKEVIPDGDISQAGSLVDADRLRFDFNCPRAVASEEVLAVENLVNEWIAYGYEVEVRSMALDEAKKAGAVAMFGEKYDTDRVRVVDVPNVSMELCGGTYVTNISDIGLFKVSSELGPSSGVRRIEAICSSAVMPYLNVRDAAIKQLSGVLKARPEELPARVSELQEELRSKSKELEQALAQLAIAKAMHLSSDAETVGDCSYIIAKLEGNVSSDSLKAAIESVGTAQGPASLVLLASVNSSKVSFVATVGKMAQKRGVMAGKLVGSVAKLCGGGGGGRPNLAQAGGKDASKLGEALDMGKKKILEALSS